MKKSPSGLRAVASAACSFLENQRRQQRNGIRFQAFGESAFWFLDSGRIAHKSGRFFSVVGLEWALLSDATWASLMIDQPEIGTLGFVVYRDEDCHFLFDAKFEPGNLKYVDFAPTLQATASNQDQVHGGVKPRLQDEVLELSGIGSPVLQSEQGTRFINKWNLNLLKESHSKFRPPAGMTWVDFGDMQTLLAKSHTLNTDARSVIVSGAWELYIPGRSGFESSLALGARLESSYSENSRPRLLEEISELLDRHGRTNFVLGTVAPLCEAGGNIIVDSSGESVGTSLVHLSVESLHREVRAWDQPLLAATGTSLEILLCAEIDGVVKFLFEPVAEVGFKGRSQLGCSSWSENPGRSAPSVNVKEVPSRSRLVATMTQSDEGGRFYRQLCTYEVRVCNNSFEEQAGLAESNWLTLREIDTLSSGQGFFTNEARTAISMLLSYL